MLTFHDLAHLPRWMLWRAETRDGRTAKVPYQPNGRRASSTDPTTWCDYETAAAARPRILNGHDGGIGIVLGDLGDLGDGTAIAGIDLDTCRTPTTGALAPWAEAVIARLDTYAEVSPSGTGVKLYFTLPTSRLDAAKSTLSRTKWSKPGGDHPEAIEVYLSARYFAVTFRPINDASIRALDLGDLAWLCSHAETTFGAGEKPNGQKGRDESRSARAFRLAAEIKRNGGSYKDFIDALQRDAELANWWETKARKHGEREAQRAWNRAPGPDGALPDLVINNGDLTETARALRDLLATRPMLFDRAGPVRLHHDATLGGLVATPLTVEGVCHEAHAVCQPVTLTKTKEGIARVPTTLPDRVARLYLALHGNHDLRPLTSIASAPILRDDGTISAGEGYDAETGIYREKCPDISVPDRPTRADAEAALLHLRRFLRTFPFADAHCDGDGFVSLAMPPGQDESAALVALLTAVCRPSLHLAPAVLIRAPSISGAGTGKGLLARVKAAIAFGRAPYAMPPGHDADEFDKRIVAAAMTAEPMLLIDNANARTLRSDTLAALITERPARIRPLGKSMLTPITTAILPFVTGNGVQLAEDLARRFLVIELDAFTEDPEARTFDTDPVAEAHRRRAELLGHALTIWRWGCQNRGALRRGRPLGSFESWVAWCRDPLLSLGCRDPAERVAAIKAEDPQRAAIRETFETWWEHHRDTEMKALDLAEPVRRALDPRERGRSYLIRRVQALVGTRLAGFALESEQGGSPAKPVHLYRLRRVA
jgi:hypothetical protein